MSMDPLLPIEQNPPRLVFFAQLGLLDSFSREPEGHGNRLEGHQESIRYGEDEAVFIGG